VTYFARYRTPAIGFDTIAGRNDGLRRIVVAAGRLGTSEGGPLHLHHGEEILHILSGEVEVTVGSEIRRCLAGDVVIIPTDTPHRFTTITETTMEVVAELDATRRRRSEPASPGSDPTPSAQPSAGGMLWLRRKRLSGS
jgi:mannose-6-phosphate isomerase-like protein (cupin superfamily)